MQDFTSPAYEPHELALMSEAFECSYKHLLDMADRRLQGRHAHYTRETIARLVLGYIRQGERDTKAICDAVIAHMDGVNGDRSEQKA